MNRTKKTGKAPTKNTEKNAKNTIQQAVIITGTDREIYTREFATWKEQVSVFVATKTFSGAYGCPQTLSFAPGGCRRDNDKFTTINRRRK